ncbi:Plectin/S10 domain-containing protein [Colletotrichum navitas]|uniref:Plectin/S10 domain-containing protein n=1 Tax=Colletotrichum navitas TaxID=681940 RepID=A0AAD8V8X4_9PEZI|nr:Plectin/S10 domain-containing protein [Colletotrichum navitas]KAK1596181.1 Plectin/S10 domain-containing protein [Colletotrichum navitas]
MLIPKADRKKIHEYLFREGVLVAKKDFNLPKHPDIDTKNLFVIKALQSLNSRGYVKTQFSWQYYYYTLTPEGLDYLREWLHLPAEIVPATHIKQQRSHAPPRGMLGEGERERRPFGGRGRGGDPVVALAVAVVPLPLRTDMYSKKWMAGTVARLLTSQTTGETSWEFGG